jgi:hypothetical protein
MACDIIARRFVAGKELDFKAARESARTLPEVAVSERGSNLQLAPPSRARSDYHSGCSRTTSGLEQSPFT